MRPTSMTWLGPSVMIRLMLQSHREPFPRRPGEQAPAGGLGPDIGRELGIHRRDLGQVGHDADVGLAPTPGVGHAPAGQILAGDRLERRGP